MNFRTSTPHKTKQPRSIRLGRLCRFKISGSMRPILTRGRIKLRGALGNSPIGLLDEPILPQQGGTPQVIFLPFSSQIGTTTIVQRLCGSNAINPNPSSGVSGYRATWSLELDSVGTCKYLNFFFWDVCYEASSKCPDILNGFLQSAKIVVLLIPAEDRGSIKRLISWVNTSQQVTESHRVIVGITRCDRIESAQIRPTDIESLSKSLNVKVVQISAANVPPDGGQDALQPSIRNLVLAISDNCIA